MPALKLFLSHSSRLDDIEHRHPDDDANRRLLREVCDGLKAHFGEAVHILVDRDGLIPGDDWNRELNLWLAECHAAVILVSRRALTKSDWVAKEAAILGWRKALDPDFTLIPVTIEGESCAADLGRGFFGSLDMGRIQAVHAQRSAEQIVAQVARGFAREETLTRGCGHTPLDLLRDAVAHMLASSQSPHTLDAALDALEPLDDEPPDPTLPHPKQCGHRLARRLLRSSVEDAGGCFDIFRHLLCYTAPPIPVGSARWLLKLVRALWVNPGAATALTTPADGHPALALCGAYVTAAGPNEGSTAYTFERYLERAWSYPREPPLVVSLTRPDMPADEVWSMIVAKVQPGHPRPTSPGAKRALQKCQVVLFVPATEEMGGVPDQERLDALIELAPSLGRLVLVFATCEAPDALPEGMCTVEPLLDLEVEDMAYSAESLEAAHFEQRYGCRP